MQTFLGPVSLEACRITHRRGGMLSFPSRLYAARSVWFTRQLPVSGVAWDLKRQTQAVGRATTKAVNSACKPAAKLAGHHSCT